MNTTPPAVRSRTRTPWRAVGAAGVAGALVLSGCTALGSTPTDPGSQTVTGQSGSTSGPVPVAPSGQAVTASQGS